MEKFQVNLEPVKDKASLCSLNCFFVGCVIFLSLGTAIGLAIFATVRLENLEREVTTMKSKLNEFWERDLSDAKEEISKKINDTENWKRSTDKRMADFQREIRRMKIENKSVPNTVPEDVRQSFNEMKDHLNALIFTTGNLSKVLKTMNTSSESKMSRLRSNLKDARNDVIRLRNEVTQLNYSLHKNMGHLGDSIVSSVKDLRQELHRLKNSTTTKANELLKHLNRTDEEIEDIIKLITQQNETLHFKIAYHSDFLYSKVKNLEKQHNSTIRSLAKLDVDLNHARDNLQHGISRVNESLHKEIETVVGSLRLSLAKVNVKVEKMKKEYEGKINGILDKQKEFQTMKNDYSESKAKFQEKDRKHDLDLSSQASKIKSMEGQMKDLKLLEKDSKKNLEKEIRDLKRRLENVENEASGIPGTNVKLIFVAIVLSICTAMHF